jgi:signal transduction histidine kinase
MSMVPVLLTVLLLAGLVAAVRLAGEQAARQRAETRALELRQQVDELEQMLTRAGQHEREWLAVLAHELRSPVGAIYGYGELIGDGALPPERTADAALRMVRAAEQILALIRGMEYVALIPGDDDTTPEPVDASDLARTAADVLAFEAEARNAVLHLEPGNSRFSTRRDQAELALLLAMGAAVKVSAGRTLHVATAATPEAGCVITVSGTGLNPDNDDPARHPQNRDLSGPGLRIALARSVAAAAGGTVALQSRADATDLVIALPDLRPTA